MNARPRRVARLAAGALVATAGVFLMIVSAPAASADDNGKADAAPPYICHAPNGQEGAKFVRQSPANAGQAHGHLTNDPWDIIPPFTYGGVEYSLNWDAAGQAIYYNNNSCSMDAVVVTTTAPPVTITTTAPIETVIITTTAPPVTITTTAGSENRTVIVTETVPGGTTTIGGENRTVTVTNLVTRTVTNQIEVAGVSSEIPSTSRGATATNPAIQVLGESASIAPAPSAGAHTGQSWGILPYLLFGGGVIVMLTSLRVRRGNSH